MKKRKGKTKRWLAGILSAVLVIGSINLVDALEGSNGESALYMKHRSLPSRREPQTMI